MAAVTIEVKREYFIPRDQDFHRVGALLTKLESSTGIWTENHVSEGEARAFLKGVEALASMLKFSIEIPEIPKEE